MTINHVYEKNSRLWQIQFHNYPFFLKKEKYSKSRIAGEPLPMVSWATSGFLARVWRPLFQTISEKSCLQGKPILSSKFGIRHQYGNAHKVWFFSFWQIMENVANQRHPNVGSFGHQLKAKFHGFWFFWPASRSIDVFYQFFWSFFNISLSLILRPIWMRITNEWNSPISIQFMVLKIPIGTSNRKEQRKEKQYPTIKWFKSGFCDSIYLSIFSQVNWICLFFTLQVLLRGIFVLLLSVCSSSHLFQIQSKVFFWKFKSRFCLNKNLNVSSVFAGTYIYEYICTLVCTRNERLKN